MDRTISSEAKSFREDYLRNILSIVNRAEDSIRDAKNSLGMLCDKRAPIEWLIICHCYPEWLIELCFR